MTSDVAKENAGLGHTPRTGQTAETAPGINQPVRDGKFECVVTDVSTPANWYGDPRPRGQRMIATMTVTNAGDKPQSFCAESETDRYGGPGVRSRLYGGAVDESRRQRDGDGHESGFLHHREGAV